MVKIKILHFIQNKAALRAHLTFSDTEEITNYYIIPLGTKNQVLIHSENKFFYKNNSTSGLETYCEDTMELIKKLEPDALIVAQANICGAYQAYFKSKIKKIYYIHHGFWSMTQINAKIHENAFFDNYLIFDKVFMMKRNAEALKKVSDKFYTINGIPQIDYMKSVDLEQKKKLIHKFPKKKSILLVTNNKANSLKEYINILSVLVRFAKKYNYHVYTKIKKSPSTKATYLASFRKANLMHRNSSITIIADDSLLYDYFFCDVVVIQTMGTSLIESLILDKPTILCQLINHTDYMDIKKYPIIPQANNVRELVRYLEIFRKYPTYCKRTNFQKERMAFLMENVGDINANSVEEISKMILKDFQILEKRRLKDLMKKEKEKRKQMEIQKQKKKEMEKQKAKEREKKIKIRKIRKIKIIKNK